MIRDNLLLSNVFHRPVRTLVSITGIGLGVLLIVATMGLANGTLRGNARREANVGAEIMVRTSGSFGISGSEPLRLLTSLVPGIARLEGVADVVPVGQVLDSASDSETGSRLIDGVEFEPYAAMAGLTIVEGIGLDDRGDKAVIDSAWANQKNLSVGSVLTIYEREFTIVGTYSPASGARIKIPLSTMQRQSGSPANCTMFLVRIAPSHDEQEVENRIAVAYPDLRVILTRDFEELYVRAVPAIDVFLNVIIAVGSVIGALVILLTMYTTVTERTRQIGILKSLGMSNAGIAVLIGKEAIVLSFLGVMLGIAMAAPIPLVLARTSSSMQMSLEASSVLITLFSSLLGGVIGALFPAIRAARMDAVDALSYD